MNQMNQMNQPTRVPISPYDAALLNKQAQRIAQSDSLLKVLQTTHQETLDNLLRNREHDPEKIGRCEIVGDNGSSYLMLYPKPEAPE